MEKKSLKIILFVNSFLPNIGGKQIVVFYLARALQQLGHKVYVVGPGAWWRFKHYEFPFPVSRFAYFGTGKLVKRLNNKWSFKIYEAFRMWALRLKVRQSKCDIIHAHMTYPNGYLAVQLSEAKKIPVIITPHGEDIQVIPELGYGLRLNPILKERISCALENAFSLTAISKNVQSALLDANAPDNKICMIPNGVDNDRFTKKVKIDAKKWLSVPADSKLIVTIGQYHPRKGHEVLVHAMQVISKQEPRAKLVIIGKSSPTLKELVKKLDLSEFVILTGQIKSPSLIKSTKDKNDEPDILAAILQCSELYVSAGISEDSEGLSLAVLESMAASLPIVASNISGNRDVIKEGKNGFLVTPGDYEDAATAILKILLDENSRDLMGEEARKTAMQSDWLEIARQYVSLYQKAISYHQ